MVSSNSKTPRGRGLLGWTFGYRSEAITSARGSPREGTLLSHLRPLRLHSIGAHNSLRGCIKTPDRVLKKRQQTVPRYNGANGLRSQLL
jgi:hypothetical protein